MNVLTNSGWKIGIMLIFLTSFIFPQSNLFVRSFEMTSNGAGPINEIVGFDVTQPPLLYGAYSADFYQDVLNGAQTILNLPDGMQNAGGWFFILAGPNDIGNNNDALNRWTRDGARDAILNGNSYEIRFTSAGGKAIMSYTTGTVVDVPFEVWKVDPFPFPNDESIRMIPWIYDEDGNDIFNFHLDHLASSNNNDPYTDWIYFRMPDDDSPGDAGYNQFVEDADNGVYDYGGVEHLGRLVLMNWNQHQNESEPGIGDGPIEAMPETGTIFRLNFGAQFVEFDIKPCNDENIVNCSSLKGLLPTAILTTEYFDASEVDPHTVVFGPELAHEAHDKGHMEDVDGDGDLDMVLHFSLDESGILPEDYQVEIQGYTMDGTYFMGVDNIRCLHSCETSIDDPGEHNKNDFRLLIAADGRIALNDEYEAHGFYPANTCDQYVYCAGPSIGGLVNGVPIVAHAPYNSEYVPSEIGNSGEFFRVFNSTIPKEKKIWPEEFCLPNGKPNIVNGAENLVIEYNDLNGTPRGDITTPLGVEVRQRSLAFRDEDVRKSIIFIWEITNISGGTIDDAYFGFWCDADVGGLHQAWDDRTSFVDDIAITWDNEFMEEDFLLSPSIVGFTFLETPEDNGIANYVAYVNGGPNQEPNQDDPQYRFLSGEDHFETDIIGDLRMLLSTSIGDLQDGESVKVAGALFIGTVPDGTIKLETETAYPFRPDPEDPILFDLLATKDKTVQFYNEQLKDLTLPKKNSIDDNNDANELPDEFVLYQNYPNPFNPTTEIRFDLPEASNVKLTIYNSIGEEVRTLVNDFLESGIYRVSWDGKDSNARKLSSGVYIYQINNGNYTLNRKMILLQ